MSLRICLASAQCLLQYRTQKDLQKLTEDNTRQIRVRMIGYGRMVWGRRASYPPGQHGQGQVNENLPLAFIFLVTDWGCEAVCWGLVQHTSPASFHGTFTQQLLWNIPSQGMITPLLKLFSVSFPKHVPLVIVREGTQLEKNLLWLLLPQPILFSITHQLYKRKDQWCYEKWQ